jgi:hypothetical protein
LSINHHLNMFSNLYGLLMIIRSCS